MLADVKPQPKHPGLDRLALDTAPEQLAAIGGASSSHAHGNVTNVGSIGSTANLPIITGASGVITVGSFGTSENTFCQGNDSRLSDARTPIAHTHPTTDLTGTLTKAQQHSQTAYLEVANFFTQPQFYSTPEAPWGPGLIEAVGTELHIAGHSVVSLRTNHGNVGGTGTEVARFTSNTATFVGNVTASGTIASTIVQLNNGSDFTQIKRLPGASGRLGIYRQNDPNTLAVSFGGGNAEIDIREGRGIITHSGADFAISALLGSNLALSGPRIDLHTGSSIARIHNSGGLSLGSTVNPGANSFSATGTITANGIRPINHNGSTGLTQYKGDAGGWSLGSQFVGSNGTILGEIGVGGSGSAIGSYYMGPVLDPHITVTGAGLQVPGVSGSGYMALSRAGASNTGFIEWFRGSAQSNPGQRQGFIGFDGGQHISLYNEQGGAFNANTHFIAGRVPATSGCRLLQANYDGNVPSHFLGGVVTEKSSAAVGFAYGMYQDDTTSWLSGWDYASVSRCAFLIDFTGVKMLATPATTSTPGSALPIQPSTVFEISPTGFISDLKVTNGTKLGIRTKATLPSAASSSGDRYQVSDSDTIANRIAFSNGSAWYYEGTAVAV